jgi:hypothetical protein
MSKEAMKLALEALEKFPEDPNPWTYRQVRLGSSKAIKALEEALASEQEQRNDRAIADSEQLGEPVAWMDKNKFEHLKKNNAVLTTVTSWGAFDDDVPLYTTPPQGEDRGLLQQQRKPLTDEQKLTIERRWNGSVFQLIEEIEAAHGIKEKNT